MDDGTQKAEKKNIEPRPCQGEQTKSFARPIFKDVIVWFTFFIIRSKWGSWFDFFVTIFQIIAPTTHYLKQRVY